MEATALKEEEGPEEDLSPLQVEWQCGDRVRARMGPRRVIYGRIVQYTNGQICSFRERDKENIYYYVETTTKRKVWAPSSGLSVWAESEETTGHALRDLDSRCEDKPLLLKNSEGKGLVKAAASNNRSDGKPRKQRKKKLDHLVPITVAQRHAGDKPDLNVEYELRTMPCTDKPSNQFKDFLRRGKDLLYDKLHEKALSNKNHPESLIKISTTVEMDHYLSNVWRYIHNCKVDFAKTTYESEASVGSEDEDTSPDVPQPPTVHVSWCVVCGQLGGELLQCGRCPVSYHEACRAGWPIAIRHRKDLTNELQEQGKTSRLRVKTVPVVGCSKEPPKLARVCPVCALGPGVTYGDIVWHKLDPWPWWPARVVPPGDLPSCLIGSRKLREATNWPLEFYGTPRQYTWAPEHRICLLIPTHYECVESAKPELRSAFMEASDDYITTYLT